MTAENHTRRRFPSRGSGLIAGWSALLLVAACSREPVEPERGARPNEGLREVELSIGDIRITAEVADTEQTRMIGLMHRDSLPADRGMLFVFPKTDYRTFHMKNVKFSLDIAFLREDGAIDEVKQMKAGSVARTYSQHRVKYALEMNQGWFESRGIGPGDRVDLSPIVEAP